MSNKNLIALTYFLYPEMTKSQIIKKKDANKIIEELCKKGISVKRKGNEVTIEIL